MNSNDIALRVENLGKMYRLGRERPKASGVAGKVKQGLGAPFEWLASQMRPPSEKETLWALKDVSFEIKRGEVVGFIGHNGAGKSTLLKILSRITEPTEGYAEIYGRIAALLEVGTGMHPELTGRENIYINGTVLGMTKSEIERNLDEIIDFSGIEKFLDTPVKRYSSGMRVRLGFAIAAHLEPEILVVDEVLAVGDLNFQKKCLGKMQNVAKSGRTVLYVSHNNASVLNLCQRGIVLRDGRIEFDGKVTEAINSYVQSCKPETRESGILEFNEDLGIGLDSIELRNNDNQVVETMMVGQPIRLQLSIRSLVDYSDCHLVLSIYDEIGTKISSLDSSTSGLRLDLESPGIICECLIPSVPLFSGRYRIQVNSFTKGQHLMWLTKWWEFEVIEGDFYGTGKLPNPITGGVFLLNHEWESKKI